MNCNKLPCDCTISLTDVVATSTLNGLCIPVNQGDTIITIINRLCQKINAGGSSEQVQSDWLTVNPNSPSYIKNKPHIWTTQELNNLVNQILANWQIDWSQIVNVPNFLTETDFLSLLQDYLSTHGYLTEGDLYTYLTTHGYITNEDFLNLLQNYLNSQDFYNLLSSLLNAYYSNYPLVETDPTVPNYVKLIPIGTDTKQVLQWNNTTYAPHILTFNDITGTINNNQYNQTDIFGFIDNYFNTIGVTNVPIATTSSLGVVEVGSGLQITTQGILSVDPYWLPPTPTSSPCGTPIAYNGGVSYPTTIQITLGSGTGIVSLSYQAYSVPDKFILIYDGVEVINTGYRGDKWRQTALNSALAARSAPPETIQGPGQGVATFNKTSATTTATLQIWAPITTTGWKAFVSCPGIPLTDATDISIYSVDGYLEQNRIVSFNNNSLTFTNGGFPSLKFYIEDLPIGSSSDKLLSLDINNQVQLVDNTGGITSLIPGNAISFTGSTINVGSLVPISSNINIATGGFDFVLSHDGTWDTGSYLDIWDYNADGSGNDAGFYYGLGTNGNESYLSVSKPNTEIANGFMKIGLNKDTNIYLGASGTGLLIDSTNSVQLPAYDQSTTFTTSMATGSPRSLLIDDVGKLVVTPTCCPLMKLSLQNYNGDTNISYPLGVFSVTGNYIGTATSTSDYISMWNSNVDNQAVGRISSGVGTAFIVVPVYINIPVTLIAMEYYSITTSSTSAELHVDDPDIVVFSTGSGTTALKAATSGVVSDSMQIWSYNNNIEFTTGSGTNPYFTDQFFYRKIICTGSLANTQIKVFHNRTSRYLGLSVFNVATAVSGILPKNMQSFYMRSSTNLNNFSNWSSVTSLKWFGLDNIGGTNLKINQMPPLPSTLLGLNMGDCTSATLSNVPTPVTATNFPVLKRMRFTGGTTNVLLANISVLTTIPRLTEILYTTTNSAPSVATATQADTIIQNIATALSGVVPVGSVKLLQLSGISTRTSASDAAYNALVAAGWNVTTGIF